MAWLIAVIAFVISLGEKTAGMSSNESFYLFLTKLNGIYEAIVPVAVIILVIGVLITVFGRDGSAGFGCSVSLFGIIIGAGAILHMFLTRGMVNSFSPETGVTDTFGFFVSAFLYAVTGFTG